MLLCKTWRSVLTSPVFLGSHERETVFPSLALFILGFMRGAEEAFSSRLYFGSTRFFCAADETT
jgi:hypothetical protein